MNRQYILTLTARAAAVLVILALLLSTSPVLAARDRTPPTQPTNLNTTAITATSVTLAWNPSTDNSGNFTYRVHMVSPSRDMSTSQTSFTWGSLSPNSTYSFYIYAIDKAGNRSTNSNTVTVTTPAPDTAPTTPTNLHTTAIAHTTATLAWNPSTDNSGSVTYRIEMSSIYSSWAMETTQTSITWTSLSPNTTYSFYVFAFDSSGNRSANSNTLTVTLTGTIPRENA